MEHSWWYCLGVGAGGTALGGGGLALFIWLHVQLSKWLIRKTPLTDESIFAIFFVGWIFLAFSTIATLTCKGVLH